MSSLTPSDMSGSVPTGPGETPQQELQRLQHELQLATERLLEQEQLAALGNLVAGVAHEINTPIGIAVTAASGMEEFARSLTRKLSGDKVSRSELQTLAGQLEDGARLVNNNLARAADLISNFKTLAVDQASEAEMHIDLSPYLRGIVMAHNPVLRSAQTRVELDTPEHLHATLVPGQFSQIVSNLIVNALTHAFQEQPEDRPRLIRVRLHSQGERLQLHFSDNGRGVPPEVRARMFEPYFTTRRGSGGSGLGLYIVHKLCEQMGGQIVVDEAHEPGLGFRVDLPLRH
ncbi:MAG: hypothetical protein CFE41_06475 [Burkholderiales bacterium PBB2]|nr:MAG: hypothetical protein CFE41_06475 [Burkholderiales bacterium PBB2]